MRFGLGVADITPTTAMPMYGYYARQDCHDGVYQPLTFTAIVLEEGERRALLGAADLGTLPRDRVRGWLAGLGARVGCPAAQVMLNVSHTHGGPLVAADDLWQPPGCDRIGAYQEFLYERMQAAADAALASLAPGSLTLFEGRTRVPMNRRKEVDGEVRFAPDHHGPTDDRLHVLALHDAAGALRGLGLRVSCHPTATGGKHQLNGDYPGAWKQAVSRCLGPEVVPFFLQGAGADTRVRVSAEADSWRPLAFAELEPLARELCREMLAAVTAAPGRRLGPLLLAGHLATATIPCDRRHTTAADFEPLLGDPETRLYAEGCLRHLAAGHPIPDSQDFLVQTLWLDPGLAFIGVSAEVLCGLGARLESAVAPAAGIVLGYTNGNGGYLPDAREMARGGYEARSYTHRLLTGPYTDELEECLRGAIARTPPAVG